MHHPDRDSGLRTGSGGALWLHRGAHATRLRAAGFGRCPRRDGAGTAQAGWFSFNCVGLPLADQIISARYCMEPPLEVNPLEGSNSVTPFRYKHAKNATTAWNLPIPSTKMTMPNAGTMAYRRDLPSTPRGPPGAFASKFWGKLRVFQPNRAKRPFWLYSIL